MMGLPLSVFNSIHLYCCAKLEMDIGRPRAKSVHYIQLNGCDLPTIFTPFNTPWKCNSRRLHFVFFFFWPLIRTWKLVLAYICPLTQHIGESNEQNRTEQNKATAATSTKLLCVLSVDFTESIYRLKIAFSPVNIWYYYFYLYLRNLKFNKCSRCALCIWQWKQKVHTINFTALYKR